MRIFICGGATALFFGLVFVTLIPERYMHLGDMVMYSAFISGAVSQMIKQINEDAGGSGNDRK